MTPAARIVLQGRFLADKLVHAVAALAGASGPICASAGQVRIGGIGARPGATVRAHMQRMCEDARADVALIDAPRRLARYRLAAMDMDSTLITIECIDEMADLHGAGPAVAAITVAAMRGEIDFPESLRRRVSILRGLPAATLKRVYLERLRLSPGAEVMLDAFRAAGLKTLLVSGGFTYFTERLKDRLGIDFTCANTLDVNAGLLTGRVIGEIVDANVKRRELLAACNRLGVPPSDAIAIGDGANDLAMMGAAGVSIAYRAKPVVRARATYAISHNGLGAVLPLFDA